MEWGTVAAMIGALGGLEFVKWAATRKAHGRKADAAAESAELENIKSFAQEWRELAEKREEQCEKKDAKIDELFRQIGEHRQAEAERDKEIARLRILEVRAQFKNCNRRGCDMREPQTGY